MRTCDMSALKAEDIEFFLSLDDPVELQKLFAFADQVRREHIGDGILLRGIVEFSNFCSKTCAYCGLNKNNLRLKRYRMSADEILDTVGMVVSNKVSTVVLQSGEDEGLSAAWLADVIACIKSRFKIAITLSVGERPLDDYRLWRNAGADRYLLKIETSDKALYESLHQGMSFDNRIQCLRQLKELGFQTGSGIIIGLKGQSVRHIAGDILFFKDWDFDMIGIGPFIPHPGTSLGHEATGEAMMTLKTVALTRIVTKTAHIPATTALGSLGEDFRKDALTAGANVLMPNFTPQPYRSLYEIYPNKRCVTEPVGSCGACMETMAASLGRHVDYGRGDSLKAS